MKIMGRPPRQKLNSSKGFALAETLVALAIIVILLGISMLGIISYVKNMKLTEMDSTARQIFVAAQNHLTSAQVTGKLKSASLGTLGTPMSKPADFPETAENPKWPGDNNGEYYFIEYSPNDPATLEESILKDMIPFGAIDETVRVDGSYIIEYNIKTASVYGVFYTDNEAGINRVDVASLNAKGGRSDTLGRIVRRDHEKDNKLVTTGYYGGAMAEELEGEHIDMPFFEIDNGERLLLKIADSNYFRKVDGKQLQTKVTVTVIGDESGKKRTFTLDLVGGPSAPSQSTFGKDTRWWTVKEIFLENGEKALYYEICLDDITTFIGQFANVCEDFRRGENLSIDVNCKSETVSTFEMNAQGKTNSLFGDDSKVEGTKPFLHRNVEISAIRHFENLDNKVSDIETGWDDTHVKIARQTKDLDWNTFSKGKNIYSYVSRTEFDLLAKNSFYGIHATTLEKYDGQGHTMSNFVITPQDDATTKAGLFQSVKPARGGTMTISNLKLDGFEVNAQGVSRDSSNPLTAGALVASIEGNATISDVVAVNGTVVSSNYSAGGLIGSIYESTGAKVTISNCASAMIVQGRGFTGGFIGEIRKATVTVSNSYSSGRTEEGTYNPSQYNVTSEKESGGFIGIVEESGTVIANNCYSTCSVDAGGSPAGGFIGVDTSTRSQYNNCYATGLVKQYSSNLEGTFACSLNTSSSNVTRCRYLKDINGNMKGVSKWGYTGGPVSTSYSELSKNVDNSKGETYAYDQPFYGGSIFPFPMVTRVGAKDLINVTGVHYGDWPKKSEMQEVALTDILYAYREGGNIPPANWYINAVDKDNNLGVVINKE